MRFQALRDARLLAVCKKTRQPTTGRMKKAVLSRGALTQANRKHLRKPAVVSPCSPVTESPETSPIPHSLKEGSHSSFKRLLPAGVVPPLLQFSAKNHYWENSLSLYLHLSQGVQMPFHPSWAVISVLRVSQSLFSCEGKPQRLICGPCSISSLDRTQEQS